jgi:two-component system, chemotaxis family, response regulator Rcp1
MMFSKSWKILLIEDNPVDEIMVRRCVIKHGIHCSLKVVSDGLQAIQLIEKLDLDSKLTTPDLVLLDLNLPRYDGLDILKRLRASDRCGQTSVIIMTGSGDQEDKSEAAKNAVSYYFQKKTDYESFQKLGNIIKEVLDIGTTERSKNIRAA